MNIRAMALSALGCCWLAADANLVIGPIVLRETRLGVIAEILDRLPPSIGNPIFVALWFALLLGWAVPLSLGFVLLLRRKRSN
jgi:hypothetical protein